MYGIRATWPSFSCALALLVLGAASASSASTFVLEIGATGNTSSLTLQDVIAGSGATVSQEGQVFSLGAGSLDGADWGLAWEAGDISWDQDPFVSFVMGFTNFTDDAQDFVFNITIPITPALTPSTRIGGSTTISLIDSTDDGVVGTLMNRAGDAGYEGLIDGASALDMLAPLNLQATMGVGVPVTLTEIVGLPVPPGIPGPQALTSIGITHNFNLTAGDQATFNSYFQVELIPEPRTGLLFGLGLAGLAARRVRP